MPGLETFQVETAARRVLRELVETFFKAQTEAEGKIKRLEEQQCNSKRQVQEVHGTLRRIQSSLSEALVFGRRMNVAEQKIEAFKESAERRHDALKDFVNQTKEMLESRSD